MMKYFIAMVLLGLSVGIFAQPTWKRQQEPTRVGVELFHSTMTANFPTAETLKKGDFEYEISHRFLLAISDGFDAAYGLDGPAKIRDALSYGLTDRIMITFGRSNLLDNWDLQFKIKLFQLPHPTLPGLAALRVGLALNTEIPPGLDRSRLDSRNFQVYVQGVYNTMFFKKKLGVGIVPSYLYNSTIFSKEVQYTFTLGNYYQYYFNKFLSVWVEYNPIVAGYQGVIEPGETGKSYNSVAFGIDIETGGHFFHVFITNNARVNPSQYLVGADRSASDGKWRLAFGISRHL